ncbi:hypothetical protein [Erwinia mallotivora]|uniref:hypothetical protein n=1 Tax=Erwinia mallotivora TaxID=69222 RepID=UPI00136452B5|nr:hypothetical protein [Erwinia mallotivora]
MTSKPALMGQALSPATTGSPVDEEIWRFACTHARVICRYELYDWQSLEKSRASSEDR